MQSSDKLGEGTQGCVLRNAVSLSSYTKNKKFYPVAEVGQVSKLFVNRESFKRELQYTKIANDIDKGKYSMLLKGYAILNKNDIQKVMRSNHRLMQKINLCQAVSSSIQSMDYLCIIFYKQVGASVFSINVPAEQMIQLCYNLYEGLQLYKSRHLLHNDIKTDNIMYIEEDKIGKLVFIDFGLASYVQNVDFQNMSTYLENYEKYFLHDPPELIAYAVIKHVQMDKEQKYQYFKKVYEHNLKSSFSAYSYKEMIISDIYSSPEEYEQELRGVFEYMYQMSDAKRDAYIKKCILYIDVYKLSMTIIDIFEKHNYVEKNNKLVNEFYINIVCKALAINPIRRDSIDVICANYKAFLPTQEKQSTSASRIPPNTPKTPIISIIQSPKSPPKMRSRL